MKGEIIRKALKTLPILAAGLVEGYHYGPKG